MILPDVAIAVFSHGQISGIGAVSADLEISCLWLSHLFEIPFLGILLRRLIMSRIIPHARSIIYAIKNGTMTKIPSDSSTS